MLCVRCLFAWLSTQNRLWIWLIDLLLEVGLINNIVNNTLNLYLTRAILHLLSLRIFFRRPIPLSSYLHRALCPCRVEETTC